MLGTVVPDVIGPDVELDQAGDCFNHRAHLKDPSVFHLIPVQIEFLDVRMLLE